MRTHIAALGFAVLTWASITTPPRAAAEDSQDARQYVQFVEEIEGNCTSRTAKQIQVKSTHPSRKIRVWLDRYHMGVGTGDRSKTDLAPGAPAEPLGCSRSFDGPQEWRLVRAAFID